MRYPLHILLLFCLSLAPLHASELYVFNLKNRNAQELIPLVQPFVGEQGAVSGKGYKLVVRTGEANIEQIRELIGELDETLRQLRVSVASADSRRDLREEYGVSGEVSTGADKGKAEVHTRVYRSDRRREAPAAQTTRVSEGHWATIQSGYAIPYQERRRNPDGTVTRILRHRDITSGFQVLPRVNDGQVVLHIRPYRRRASQHGGGAVDVQAVQTTVSGKLGEWIPLGGASEAIREQRDALTSRIHTRRRDQQQIWVKVEAIE